MQKKNETYEIVFKKVDSSGYIVKAKNEGEAVNKAKKKWMQDNKPEVSFVNREC
jgi:hypothetical protein